MPDPGYEPDWMLFSFLFGLMITVVGWIYYRIKELVERARRDRERERQQERDTQ